jgi:hypothetical protein
MESIWHRVFTAHPRSVGESYAEHFFVAARFGRRLLLAGLACLLHAIAPGCCSSAATRIVAELAADMDTRRRRGSAAAPVYALTAAMADSSSSAASLHSRSRS